MTCDSCKSIDFDLFLDDTSRQWHHPTLEELRACSRSGDCQFCEWMASDLEAELQRNGITDYNLVEDKYSLYSNHNFLKSKLAESWHGISKFSITTFLNGGVRDFSPPFEVFVDRGSQVLVCESFIIVLELMHLLGSKLAETKKVSGRSILKSADDESCFQLAMEWRDTCLEGHSELCPIPIKRALPTRVIDVGYPNDHPNDSHQPWLKITENKTGEWLALSHCWGIESRFVTDTNNISERKRFIPLENMPQTFRDAVTVTRKLGYQYLWIDSLCILQNSREDWVAESARMIDYYKHATITIVADSAPGDHVGFLNQHRPAYESLQGKLRSGEEISIRRPVPCPKFTNRDTYVSKRAWTLQEVALSPRSLHYTSTQLVWECYTHKYCESNDNPQRDIETTSPNSNLKISPIKSHQIFSHWYKLVGSYMNRNITYASDILPAISGIAREFQQRTGKTYAAGIWIEDIHEGLVWRTYGTGRRSKTYCAPTWSWASVGPLTDAMSHLYLKAKGHTFEKKIERVQLISYEVITKEGDPFGCISFGSICLQGRTFLAKNWRAGTKPYFNSHGSIHSSYTYSMEYNSEGLDNGQLICHFDVHDEEAALEEALSDTMIFHISLNAMDISNEGIRHNVAVSLLLVQVMDEPTETYRRVGVVEVPVAHNNPWEGWEMKDVRII